MGEKFGRDRHRPPGDWIQTTGLLKVAGVSYRRTDALAFASAVRKSEAGRLAYGLRLRPDPQNRHDPNAIEIHGYAERRRFLRGTEQQSWHIGFVPAEEAAELSPDILSKGLDFAAELYGVWLNKDYVEIEFFVIIPKCSPATKRRASRAAASAAIDSAPLTPEQMRLLERGDLGLYRNTRLEQAEGLKRVGEPEAALIMYLRVSWLDCAGPNNSGGRAAAFTRQFTDPAPGIVRAIAMGANALGKDIEALKAQFMVAAERERAAIAPLSPPNSDAAAWHKLHEPLAAQLATGSKWRAPKALPTPDSLP